MSPRRGLAASLLVLATSLAAIPFARAQQAAEAPAAAVAGAAAPAVAPPAGVQLPPSTTAVPAPADGAPADGIPDQLRWGDFYPASPGVLTVHQPDGTAFQAVLTNAEVGGDLELDGYTLTKGVDGWWRYASGRDGDGALVASDRLAGIDAAPVDVPPGVGRIRNIWEGPGGVDTRTEALRQLQIGFHRAARAAAAAGETITFRFPVLMLATWWDEEAGQTEPQFQEGNTPERFQELLSGFGGNPTGTLTEFYFENSYGRFVVEVGVHGPFTSQRSREDRCYYGGIEPGDDGGGDLDLVDDQLGIGGAGSFCMAVEAVPQADPTVDFSQYDNDGDGFVDFTAILHSGPDMAATGDPCHTWSHAIEAGLAGGLAEGVLGLPPGTLEHGIPTSDGVLVNRLFTMPEIDLEIGVATHEMAHALGEPDYYNPSYTSMGTGDWDIMAGGSWFGNPPGSNPTHFNPASRVFQGWTTPTIIHDDVRNLTIPPRELTPSGFAPDQPNPQMILVPTRWINVGDVDETDHEWTETDVYGLVRDGDRGYVIEGYYIENISRVVNAPPIHPEMDRAPYFDRQALSSGLMVWHFDYIRRSNVYFGANDAGSDPNRPQMDPMEFDFNDDSQELQLGLTRGETTDLVWDAATGITSGTRMPHGAGAGEGGSPQGPETWTGALTPATPHEHEITVEDNPANRAMKVTIVGDGDCKLELFDPSGEQVGGTQDSGAFGDSETISVNDPAPGAWTVVVSDFAGCFTYNGEVTFQAVGDAFDTTGAADTWSNETEEPTGWAFTNVRPASGDRSLSTPLSGAHEVGPEGITLDILNIGFTEADLSPGFIRPSNPVNVGRPARLHVPIFNNGGVPAAAPVTIRRGSETGPVVTTGVVDVPAYGRSLFTFEVVPTAEGTERFVAVVDPANTVTEVHEGNNVQAAEVDAGPANPTVLIVHDAGGADTDDVYAGALSALGVPYSVVARHADAALMRQYRLVIWEAGLERYQGQMDRNDRAAVAEYLRGGGQLLYTSPRSAAALGEGVTSTSPTNSADMPVFLAEFFGVEYLDTLQVGGGRVTGLGDVLAAQEYNTDVYPGRPLQDVWTAATEGVGGTVTPVADWEKGGDAALMGVRVTGDAAHGNFRTAFLGFNLSQLTSSSQVVDVLDRMLTHFGVPRTALVHPVPLLFHTQVRNRTAGTPTPISAIVVGPVSGVRLEYRAHGAPTFTSVAMDQTPRSGTYRYVIPADAVTPAGIEYRIVVTGGGRTVVDGPHAIGVQRA
jgi:M6 family metalloprotease-like protein